MEVDYIVVGSGSAGCPLANRLSQDPKVSVLLLEAGPSDRHPLVNMPKGFGKLQGNQKFAWHFPQRPFPPLHQQETWARGKVLGGSSAINGMIYNRGNQADFDQLGDLGLAPWGWDHVVSAYREIEDNELGATRTRGSGGPLHVSRLRGADPVCDQIIAAGDSLGWKAVDDYNEIDEERIGYAMCTIKNGRRVSAAHAFIHPILDRPNLTVATGSCAQQLLRTGDRITGIRVRHGGADVDHRARREVILSAGSVASPKLLQLSGIGPGDVLRAAGIDVVVDSPGIGRGMREHRCLAFHYRLNRNVGYNKMLSTVPRQALTTLRYWANRTGPMATPAYDVVGFIKALPESGRPDAQLLVTPLSLANANLKEPRLEREPGMQCIGYVLRPEAEGTISITGPEADAPLEIIPNYLGKPYDRSVAVGLFRSIRKLFTTEPLASLIVRETQPGAGVSDDDDEAMTNAVLTSGYCGYHSVGTVAMGTTDAAPLDPELRVRGVEGLRVVDTSVFPTMVSGNCNAPTMAFGWIAGQRILGEGS